MDVAVPVVALIGFNLVEGGRRRIPNLRIPIVGACAVGVSLVLLTREIETA